MITTAEQHSHALIALLDKIQTVTVENRKTLSLSVEELSRLEELRRKGRKRQDRRPESWKLTPVSNLRSMGIPVQGPLDMLEAPPATPFWESVASYGVQKYFGGRS